MAMSKNGMLEFFPAESRSPEVNRRGYLLKLGFKSQHGDYERAYNRAVTTLSTCIQLNESVMQAEDPDVKEAKSFLDALSKSKETMLELLKSYDVNQKKPAGDPIGNKVQFSEFEDIDLKKLGEAIILVTERIDEINQAQYALNAEYVAISQDPKQKDRCEILKAKSREYTPELQKLERINTLLQRLTLCYHPASPSARRHKLFSSAQKEPVSVASSNSQSLERSGPR